MCLIHLVGALGVESHGKKMLLNYMWAMGSPPDYDAQGWGFMADTAYSDSCCINNNYVLLQFEYQPLLKKNLKKNIAKTHIRNTPPHAPL